MPKLPKGMVKKGNAYYLRVRKCVDGVRSETTVALGSDLEQARIDYRRMRRREEESVGQPTLEAFARRWVKEYCGAMRNPKGQKLATQRMEHFVLPAWGKRLLPELTTADIIGLKATLLRCGRSTMTVRHILADVSCLLNFAVSAQLLDRSPFTRQCWPRVQQEIPDPLSEVELLRVLEIVRDKPRLRAMVQVGLLTGLRYSEIRGLMWSRVELEGDSPYVLVTRSGHAEHTKSKKPRRVRLLPEAREMIREQPRRSQWVFTGIRGQQIGTDSGWINAPIAREVKGFHFHRLRHTFASRLLAVPGIDIKLIQLLLGHSTVTTTERYARLFDGYVDRALDALPASWMPTAFEPTRVVGEEGGRSGEGPAAPLAVVERKK